MLCFDDSDHCDRQCSGWIRLNTMRNSKSDEHGFRYHLRLEGAQKLIVGTEGLTDLRLLNMLSVSAS
jgi:hypothetical protein